MQADPYALKEGYDEKQAFAMTPKPIKANDLEARSVFSQAIENVRSTRGKVLQNLDISSKSEKKKTVKKFRERETECPTQKSPFNKPYVVNYKDHAQIQHLYELQTTSPVTMFEGMGEQSSEKTKGKRMYD